MTIKEAIKEAKKCENIDEFKELLTKNNYEVSEQEAYSLFNRAKNYKLEAGELSDDELTNASGGSGIIHTGCSDSDLTPKWQVGQYCWYKEFITVYRTKIIGVSKTTSRCGTIFGDDVFTYTLEWEGKGACKFYNVPEYDLLDEQPL